MNYSGAIVVLAVALSAVIIVREGYHPLSLIGAAATGDLVLKAAA